MNLLGNAVKFTEHGSITLRAERDTVEAAPGAIRFIVSDTGIGIPQDKLTTIFEDFTQVDTSTTRQYGGTGLGLAIAKKLVELMGGRIWAESTPGAGATFRFTAKFEIAATQPQVAAPQPPAVSESADLTRPIRILFADDSEDNRFLIRSYLRNSVCTIDEAENGAIAVLKFKSRSYHLVLTDVEMPVLDGYSAARQMRQWEKETGQSPTPILALTAHALVEATLKSLAAGCDAHLTKPIRRATLLEAVQRYARRDLPPLNQVVVDSWLEPVIPRYLEKRREDLATLRGALADCDYDSVRKLGHQMRGTGAGYGLAAISEIGGALEDAAVAGDAERMKDQIEELARFLSTIAVAFRAG